MKRFIWRLIFTLWSIDMFAAWLSPVKSYDIWRDSKWRYHYGMDAYEEALKYWRGYK